MSNIESKQSFKPVFSLTRFLVSEVTYPFLEYRVIDRYNGMSDSQKYLENNHSGLIVIFNHFCLADGLVMARFAVDFLAFGNRQILMPIAYHQYEAFKYLFKPVTCLTGLELDPVVIQDTLKRTKYENLTLGAGMLTYVKDAIPVLNNNGVVLLNPQEGRRPHLGKPEVPALSLIAMNALKHGIDELALLPVGISLPGVTDYESITGMHFDTPSVLNIGKLSLISDIVSTPITRDTRSAVQNTIDNWAFESLAEVTTIPYGGRLPVE